MFIRRSRIINLDRYLDQLESHNFHVIYDLSVDREAALAAIGFPENPANGDRVLPLIKGKVSRFNAEGGWVIHRDQPKERRYIRTVFWQWRTWGGDEYSDFRDIYRECYPRTQVPPPSVELTYRELGERRIITSPLLIKDGANREQNKHVINLFLELVGSCTLVGEDMAIPAFPHPRQLNWRFLPPGARPWEALEEHIKGMVPDTSSGSRVIALDRARTLHSYGPDETYTGTAGYHDYIAYVFKTRGITILDSVRRDNALYVFGQNWERCSRLTKAEVLGGALHHKRIVHSDGWRSRLAQLMRRSEAA